MTARGRCIRAGLLVHALACAGRSTPVERVRPLDEATAAPWRALLEGRIDAALAGFDRRGEEPGDLLATFGRAAVEFDRARSAAALSGYMTIVEAAAAGRGGPWAPVLAPMSAARLAVLVEEVADRRAAEERLLAVRRARLPWEAQAELAVLADRIARRRGDVELLREQARVSGCARKVVHLGAVGTLPNIDFEATTPWRPLGRPVEAAGCRLTVVAADGRPGIQVLAAALDGAGGEYDLVLEYAGLARLTLDGSRAHHHGSELVWGPNRSAARVRLAPGRHALEIRLATSGGAAELMLLALPVGAAVTSFVPPASAMPAPPGSEELPPPPTVVAPAGVGGEVVDAIVELGRAGAALAAYDLEDALTLAARLAARRRFAPALALAGAITARDGTRPANLARDAARALAVKALAVDPEAARVWHALATYDLADDHPQRAIEHAVRAARTAPDWWRPELLLQEAYRVRGLGRDADRALDRALERGGSACPVLEAAVRRARERRDADDEERLTARLGRCDAEADTPVERLRARGDMDAAAAALRGRLALEPDLTVRSDLAAVLLAAGDAAGSAAELRALVAAVPREPSYRVRLADALVAAGDRAGARRVLDEAVRAHADSADIRRAARVFGVPLPVDPFRLDGTKVIREFVASGRRYDAPAVMVLDRTVVRVLPDGAQLVLTHNIARVQSKDGIDRWGEVAVPDGGEVLTLRTHKPDGSTREPEEIAGKDTISAAELEVGDYLEWETLETRAAAEAFAGGFLTDRFFFQSFEAPLDRSEFLVITPLGMPVEFDRRAGVATAPTLDEAPGPDGTVVRSFLTRQAPQLFAEDASVPIVELIPSVCASSGVDVKSWTRFIRETLAGTLRGSPALRSVAGSIGPRGGSPEARAAALVRWVTDHVDETEDLRAATFTLARGQGGRLGLLLALAREMGLRARAVLARSRLRAADGAPVVAQELEEFAEPLVRFDLPGGPRWVDPRVRHAPFGYLDPRLDGAATLALDGGRERAFGVGEERRDVTLRLRLDASGGATGEVNEELGGWSAIEWAEATERLGGDRARLRQEFEQRWLAAQFPGASLRDLAVDIDAAAPGRARLRYSFSIARLALRSGAELKLQPTFFRSQPGRRYATAPARATPLVLGWEASLRLEARIELPASARVLDVGLAAAAEVAGPGGLRFREERAVVAGGAPCVIIRRLTAIPLQRVAPADYGRVAADLRRVDAFEQAEIRVLLRQTEEGR